MHKRYITIVNRVSRDIIASVDLESKEVLLTNDVDVKESEFEPLLCYNDGKIRLKASSAADGVLNNEG